MELSKKLSALRKQRGLTQEELASSLFVSRAAISKWESGRGYPSIDSIKTLARFYGVSIDALLSCEEALHLTQTEDKQDKQHILCLVFGLLDLSAALFFVLPLFRQQTGDVIYAVSLRSLTGTLPLLRVAYFAAVIAIISAGVAALALQNCQHPLWQRSLLMLSFLPEMLTALLFIIGLHPYAAALALILLASKALLLVKQR